MTARTGDDHFTIQGIRMLAPTLRHAVLSAITAAALLAASTATAQVDPDNPPDETRSTATAYARPMKVVKIDGDLSDWPKDTPWYPLLTEYGVYGPTDVAAKNLLDNDDMTARFSVGYSTTNNALLIAVVVRDDVHVVGNTYNNTDGLEVYIDGSATPGKGLVANAQRGNIQYSLVAGEGSYENNGKKVNSLWATGAAAFVTFGYSRDEATRLTTYEMSVPVFTAFLENAPQRAELAPGQRYWFDAAVADFDNDGLAPALVFWGPIGSMKYSNPELLGDIVLLAADQTLHTIKGAAVQPDGSPLANQQLAFTTGGLPAGEVMTDGQGRFTFALPAGDYELATARLASARATKAVPFTVSVDGVRGELKLEASAVKVPAILQKAMDRYKDAKFYSDDTRVIFNSSQPQAGDVDTRFSFNMMFEAPAKLNIVTDNNIVIAADGQTLSITSGGQPTAKPVELDGRLTVLDLAQAWGGFPTLRQPVNFQNMHRTNGELPIGGAIGGLFVHKLLFDPEKSLHHAHSIETIGAATLNRKPMTMVQIVQPAVDVFPGLPFGGTRRGVSTSLMLWIDEDGVIHQSRFRFDMSEIYPRAARGLRAMPVLLLTAQHTNISFEAPKVGQE